MQSELKIYKLWKPPIIKESGHYHIWQFSESGKTNGISGTVDLEKFHQNFNL